MKKRNLYSILIVMIGGILQSMNAQDNAPILLFPDGAPGEKATLVEKAEIDGPLVGGESVLRITNVSEPTITVFPALEEQATGTAVLVCPGGGYQILAYDLEGDEICEWLNEIGITAVLLKYRVPRRTGQPKHLAPLQDAQQAIRYMRFHAKDLGIAPDKIGVMGFSAGAHLAAMTCIAASATDSLVAESTTTDFLEKVSVRPDFCMLVYPAYLSGEGAAFSLAPEVHVTKDIPPTMIVQAEDDKNHINSSLFYYYALKEAEVPAALHIYSNGGHGYGLRETGADVNDWIFRAEDWLRSRTLIP